VWLRGNKSSGLLRAALLGKAPGNFRRSQNWIGPRRKARQILELYESLKKQALDLTHSQYAVPLLDLLFKDPIFKSTFACGAIGYAE
jgi:hypothetical protein